MLCACCTVQAIVEIKDDAGRVWRFEPTRMFGPFLVDRGGDPLSRQPGSRSAFWPAWEKWNTDQKRRHALGKRKEAL